MQTVDWLGVLGSILVFSTFWMTSTIRLRIMALASNLVFIAYAFSALLVPILVLHCALLPLNLIRLWQRHRELQSIAKRQRLVRPAVPREIAGHTGAQPSAAGSASEAF